MTNVFYSIERKVLFFGQIHPEFTLNWPWMLTECFNNNNSITTIQYIIYGLFGEKVHLLVWQVEVRKVGIRWACVDRDVWAVSCNGESRAVCWETGMHTVELQYVWLDECIELEELELLRAWSWTMELEKLEELGWVSLTTGN